MEEWVGRHWDRWARRRAGDDPAAAPAAARLAEQRRAVEWLLRAGGSSLRVAEAAPLVVGGPRTTWQRVAGTGLRLPLPQLDDAVLALLAMAAPYADAALNRDLYLGWAALACTMDRRLPWVEANLQAEREALRLFPGLAGRLDALRAAEAARRGQPWPAPGSERSAQAPVWIWLWPHPEVGALGGAAAASTSDPHPNTAAREAAAEALAGRRQARRAPAGSPRPPLLLAAKGESIRTFVDALALDRGHDDEHDGSARTAAEEIAAPTILPGSTPGRGRVRFDLDLPSAAGDDVPLGTGLWLPEWNPRLARLEPNRVHAQPLEAQSPAGWAAPAALRAEAARVRRRLEGQRAAMRWQRGEPEGEEIDLDAWVRHAGEGTGGVPARGLYRRRVRAERELATLLLADLSLSTDAYATDSQRVIDVIRDALFVFGEALAGSGDRFAITGFSSVKRQLRLHPLKTFDEPWGAAPRARLGALRPGWYTRMGAALRAGTRQLQARPERRRLLLLLTDGKPHDLDGYDGRLGLEDTREAVREARRAGLLPFAITIADDDATEAMPLLFGSSGGQRGCGGWARVRRPEEVPRRLAGLYAQLLR
jgi:nitric oxide reductase NorD protein